MSLQCHAINNMSHIKTHNMSFLDLIRLVKGYYCFKNQSSLNLHNGKSSSKNNNKSNLIIPDNNDSNNGIQNLAYTQFDQLLNEDQQLPTNSLCPGGELPSSRYNCNGPNDLNIADDNKNRSKSNNNNSQQHGDNNCQNNNNILRQAKSAHSDIGNGLVGYRQAFNDYDKDQCNNNNSSNSQTASGGLYATSAVTPTTKVKSTPTLLPPPSPQQPTASSPLVTVENNSNKLGQSSQLTTATAAPPPTTATSASTRATTTTTATSSVPARLGRIRNATFKIAKNGGGGSLSSGCSHNSNSDSSGNSSCCSPTSGNIIITSSGSASSASSASSKEDNILNINNNNTCEYYDFDDDLEVISSPSASFTSSSAAMMLTTGQQEDEEEQQQYEIIDNVVMDKRERSFGFTIQHLNDQFYIKELVREPAISCGRIKPGDQILLVNGCDISTFTHAEAVDFLRSQPRVHLVLKRLKNLQQQQPQQQSQQQQQPKSNRIRKQLRQEALIYIRETANLRNSAGSNAQPTKTRKGLGRSHNTTTSSKDDSGSPSDPLVLSN